MALRRQRAVEQVRGVGAHGRERVDGRARPHRVGGHLRPGHSRAQGAARAVPRQRPHLRRSGQRPAHGIHVVGDQEGQLENLQAAKRVR